MVNIEHHPPEEILLDYSTGALDYETSVLVASHMTFCTHCRKEVRRFEEIGGAVLAANPSADVTAFDPATHVSVSPDDVTPPADTWDLDVALPRPLLRAFGASAAKPHWTRVFPGVREICLPHGDMSERARLLSLSPGCSTPQHTHEGLELTLVLTGAFQDGIGHYRAGDVACSGTDVTHRPVADSDGDCICFVVAEAPMRLNGPFGRILNLFTRP